MRIGEFQQLIDRMYSDRDRRRGSAATFLWLMEEIGELASEIGAGSLDKKRLASEFADVLAWLATLANIEGIDLEDACLKKYGRGCPGCGNMICSCDQSKKP